MKKHIPNLITLANLFLGCCAVVSILAGQYMAGFWFILGAVLADYADGLVARLLGVYSDLGKELDSIADMVSFGVAPGAIYYMLLLSASGQEGAEGLQWAAAPGFLVSAFSGYRLAKFNLDDRQTDGFIGLPTPSSTMFAAGLMLIYTLDSYGIGHGVVASPYPLYAIIVLQSYLLIAEVPMFALKFKSLRWAGNEVKFIFAGIAALLLIIIREAAFSAVVALYVIFSVARQLVHRS
ncbi:CDP-alcohol phosphatidyltransferase family protein [Phaeodactylibacter luteus]|uniref:CDP-diacylglycerol--serine O-phosphatidyltransferase n=1 Tax=Phaeodactylibacter luteus TaxID=1564516 RepID=A0A5C6RKQ7_9BACT|nr:CDP-alcohol phosphatidyltransferase family protein [Phaeodactylibacter luteus]TXB62525.1 CDP-diacylglycerol--serine O-phosphatidyltransferase [Phaeodactylibacter luteus]